VSGEYAFDERLAFASTPPSRWYTDPAFLARERDRVFARTWQLVGRAEQVAEPGDYFTAIVAGEPLVVARGADDALRAFSNVCRHRAGPVASGEGRRKSFRCGYHGWTYALDGRLLNAPEFEGVECFSRDSTRLPEFRVETWGALVFVNLDAGCAPLAEAFGDLPRQVDLAGMRLVERRDWSVECNWKAYVDNYLEGYHIPVVHPSLNRMLDYAEYRVETRGLYSIQHSPIRGASAGDEARYFWVFPNLMLNVYPDNFSTNLVVPVDAERTLTIFEWFAREPERPEVRDGLRVGVERSVEVQDEDVAICEAVQRGLRSRGYSSGRYSVKRENGVHHFHGLLAKYLAADERA
jgi:choline monooxygenase